MDPIQFPENLSELSADELNTLATDARAALSELLEITAPTRAQADEAERVWAGLQTVDGEVAAHANAGDRLAAVRTAFTAEPETPAEPEEPAEPPVATPTPVEATVETPAVETPAVETPAEPVAAAAEPVTLNTDAVEGQRPAGTAVEVAPSTKFRAAANVQQFNIGQEVNGLDIATALLEKFRRFPKPSGKSKTFGGDLHTYPLVEIDRGIPEELTITERMGPAEIEAVFARVEDQSRLQGGSLVAAGGWCAPSQLDYGLADDGSTTSLLWDAPTVGLSRGGLKFTLGPDFADIYALDNFFKVTEAEAIAGTGDKTCFTVECPDFEDNRMDAYGYCFQIPFLTEAAYPEIIRRYLSGSMTAYAHKMDIEKITQLLALFPAAETLSNSDLGATSLSLAHSLVFIVDRERTKRRWNPNQAVQVDLPMWVKGAIKLDLATRTARASVQVTDAEVNAIFALANATPRWLYNFSPLDDTDDAYPDEFDVLIYKAGTFVVGTTNVVNLSSVYDAASLADNIYTGAFFEEGMVVMRRGFGGVRVTVPVCNSGKTGAANIDLCPVAP